MAKILPAVTDALWKMGYKNEDIAKVYAGNKLRVYQQVWEGVAPEQHDAGLKDRYKLRHELKHRYQSR